FTLGEEAGAFDELEDLAGTAALLDEPGEPELTTGRVVPSIPARSTPAQPPAAAFAHDNGIPLEAEDTGHGLDLLPETGAPIPVPTLGPSAPPAPTPTFKPPPTRRSPAPPARATARSTSGRPWRPANPPPPRRRPPASNTCSTSPKRPPPPSRRPSTTTPRRP